MTELQSLINHHAILLPSDVQGRYYLASPYTADDPAQTQKWVKEMIGIYPRVIQAYPSIVPLSPVIITPALADACVPASGRYAFGLELLEDAEGMIIVQQDGWQDSHSILVELGYAIAKGLPIALLDPDFIYSDVLNLPGCDLGPILDN